jgi:hypothetical protein
MAQINWIKANLKGKLGEIVGSSWRGKPYVKTYTKPRDPKTSEQMAIREVFRNVTSITKAIYHQILKPYTLPQPKKCTAYNQMVRLNKQMFQDKIWDPTKLIIFDGPLFNRGFTIQPEISISSNTIVAGLYPDLGSNGRDSDMVLGLVYDHNSGITCISPFAYTRKFSNNSPPMIEIDIDQILEAYPDKDALDIANLHVYLFYIQLPAEGSGESGMVSRTVYSPVIKS